MSYERKLKSGVINAVEEMEMSASVTPEGRVYVAGRIRGINKVFRWILPENVKAEPPSVNITWTTP